MHHHTLNLMTLCADGTAVAQGNAEDIGAPYEPRLL